MDNSNPIFTLTGTVQQAAAGLTGFDVNQVLSAADAAMLKDAGYDFCIRYIPRTAALIRHNLSNAEALAISNAGLALMAVQHVANEGWSPTASLGTAYGSYAAIYCRQIGLPAGINIWLDLEGVASDSAAADVIGYCQAWYNEVNTAGYVPGIYVGFGVILTPQQLYNNLPFKHYWRAYNGPQVATRGYQLLQKTEVTVGGITIDPNETKMDMRGDAVFWLAPAGTALA